MTKSDLGGLSVLEMLRPPQGYRTAAALGTTYSADLVACMVALTTLDGVMTEESNFRRSDVLAALARLKRRVRIAAQRARIAGLGKAPRPLLALLDQIVVDVAFDEATRSFHPKVWLVRYEPVRDVIGEIRYLLLVGSRNITAAPAWDLGVALTGRERRLPGTSRLRNLRAFVRRIAVLIPEPELNRWFRDLDGMHWTLPPGVEELRFGFLPEDGRPPRTGAATRLPLPEGREVLVLSPFLDAASLRQVTTHWATADTRRLVAGRPDLDRISRRLPNNGHDKGRPKARAASALQLWDTLAVGVASDGPTAHPRDLESPAGDGTGEVEEGEIPGDRGLHAKAVAVTTGSGRATLLLGSPNLTQRAWSRGNVEAFVVLEGRRRLADALWAWSRTHGQPYTPPVDAAPPEAEDRVLEDLRKRLATVDFRLRDALPALGWNVDSILTCRPALPWGALAGTSLRVARLSMAEREVLWTAGTAQVRLPPCRPGQRTRFVVFRLVGGQMEVAWVQTVRVSPPIDEARDDAALTELLTGGELWAYLRRLLAGPGGRSSQAGDSPGGDGEDGGGGGAPDRSARLSLEEILRHVSRDPRIVEDVDRTLTRLGRQLRERADRVPDDDRAFLRELQSAWRIVRRGLQP